MPDATSTRAPISISGEEISRLFAESPTLAGRGDLLASAQALYRVLAARRGELTALVSSETGFVARDALETVEGCLQLLQSYRPAAKLPSPPVLTAGGTRRIEISEAPWGLILAILPQNAFLFLGLTCLLHALETGNRVILRSPAGSGALAQILADALAAIPGFDAAIVVLAPASELVDAFLASRTPGLLHYFGGSERVPQLLSQSFSSGKGILADGEGNTWVYVGEDYDPRSAASILTSGATRYNGQTCTSVNGAVIHPRVFESVLDHLKVSFGRLGHQEVGPLVSVAQAQHCLAVVNDSQGKIITGGLVNGSRLDPTLVDQPADGSGLVTDGVFGPVLWVMPGDPERFEQLWATNRYPLCAGVLGFTDPARWSRLPNLARLVVNGDPSIEDPSEPWGGYPSSGNSNVAGWRDKYLRTVQIDRPNPASAYAVVASS